jgi:hypothetical protein
VQLSFDRVPRFFFQIMVLDAEWPWDFQIVVIKKILTNIDEVMVFSKFVARKFLQHFDHSFEERPTYIA